MTRSPTTSGELAEAPVRDLAAGVVGRVARPHDGAAAGVERVQDPGRAEAVDAAAAEGRRPARAGAAVRLPEPGGVAVPPHRLAGGDAVAGDDLVVAALLLGVEEIAADREGRPARPDRAAPQRDGRRRRPVGRDPRAANDAVAMGSRGSRASRRAPRRGPGLRYGSRRGLAAGSRRVAPRALSQWPRTRSPETPRSREPRAAEGAARRPRAAAGSVDRLAGQEPFLGRRRPPPVEVRPATTPLIPPVRTSANTPHAGQDGGDHRRAPRRWGEPPPAAAQATRARLRTGDRPGSRAATPFRRWQSTGRAGGVPPPPRATIRTIAPRRSGQGARLKNSHHTTISRPATTAPIIPKRQDLGRGGAEPARRAGSGRRPRRRATAEAASEGSVRRPSRLSSHTPSRDGISRLLRPKRLHHVHARGARGRHQRRQSGGAHEHGRRAQHGQAPGSRTLST